MLVETTPDQIQPSPIDPLCSFKNELQFQIEIFTNFLNFNLIKKFLLNIFFNSHHKRHKCVRGTIALAI